MANRTYLYSAAQDLSNLQDISEFNWDTPILYVILMSVDARAEKSKIWEFPEPIAIQADMRAGLDQYYRLLDYLVALGQPKEKMLGYRAATEKFFEKEPNRLQDRFFMEAGEVYDMEGGDLRSLNDQLLGRIQQVGKDLQTLLAHPEVPLPAEKTPHWLKVVLEDTSVLEPYWTHVTYFSFNR